MQTTLKHLTLSLCLAGAMATSCGNLHAAEPSSRIVGGEQIDISTAPATVALLRRARVETDGDLFQAQFCGGTVIDSNWILTAAHCLVDRNNNPDQASSVMVLMDSTDLANPVNQPVGVTQIIVHEDYRDTSTGRDIALLRLESAALVNAIAMERESVAVNDVAFIAGWGAINSGDDGSDQLFPTRLRGASVRMVPGESCGTLYPEYSTYGIGSTNICAGVDEGGIDTCQGDSGGPMYRVSADGLRIESVVGITSWGIGCANAANPGVYTNVASYIDWVQSKTQIIFDDTQPPVSPEPPFNDQPAAVADVEDDDFLGSNGSFMLSLLGITLLLRRRISASGAKKSSDSHTVVVGKSDNRNVALSLAAAVLFTFSGVQHVQASDSKTHELSLLDQPIGESFEAVIASAKTLYASQPVCTTVRTGFGMTRRAYFLETCTFKNTAGHTLFDSTPSQVEFRFLEAELVQVAYEFDEIQNAEKFRKCIVDQGKALVKATDSKHAISADEQFRTTVSDIESVEQIHLLRKKS